MINQRQKRYLFAAILLFFIASFIPAQGVAQQLRNGKWVQMKTLSPASEMFYQSDLDIKISVDFSGISLEQALQRIAQKARLKLTYRGDIMVDKKVTLQDKDITVSDALNKALQGTALDYRFSRNRYLLIIPKEVKFKKVAAAVSGTVTDAQTGETLPGVNILVKGTTTGTITDSTGHYSLNVPSLQDTLVFSYIGYKQRTVPISGRTKINVSLKPSVLSGEQMVVVGYGKEKKLSVIGAVKSIKPKELQAPTSQLSNTFVGKIAGIIGVQRSGEPGHNDTQFWIRGVSTFGANKNPLIIIDGVEATQADLNALPPQAIEGFSVLEDASSTALYGARGANGVIVVTTKTGEKGKMKVNGRLQTSISQPTKIPEFADGVTFMQNYRQAVLTRAIDPSQAQLRYSKEKIKYTKQGLNPYVFPDVNWHDLIFKKRAINQNLDLNVSGGGNRLRYFLNASIRHDQGLYRKFKNKALDIGENNFRYTFQNNITANITPSTKVGVKINAILNNYTRPDADTGTLYSQALTTPPVEFPPFFPSEKGDNYIRFGNNTGGPHKSGLYTNPFATYAQGIRLFTATTVKAIFNFDQKLDFITKGLEVRGLASFRNYSRKKNHRFYDPNYFLVKNYIMDDGRVKDYTVGPAQPLNSNLLHYSHPSEGRKLINIHGILKYRRSFRSRHNISATAVYIQRNLVHNADDLPYRDQGISGRLTYNYDQRYFVEGDVGYTGTANFAQGHRFGLFPSFAVGYVISNEKFFEPLTNIVSRFKLRASYGLVGNEKTSERFPYMTTVKLNNQKYVFGNDFDNTASGPLISKYGTPSSSWEESRKLNLGIDIGFLNHIKLSTDYFFEDRTGIFMRRSTIPYAFGIGSARPFANIGEVVNKGVDASLTAEYSRNNFSLSFKGTFTYAHNEIRAQDVPFNVPDYLSPIGKPINNFKGLHADGLLRPEDLNDGIIRNSFSGVMAGDIKYVDLNGDGKIDNNDRYRTKNKTYLPEIIYGFGPSIRYKRFDLSLFFQGVGRVYLKMSDIYPFGQQRRSLLQFIADNHWTEKNKNYRAIYPRLSQNQLQNNTHSSDYWIRNAAYLRLKRAELGYSFKNFRIYLSGMNLLTFAPFQLWDPELGNGNGLAYPPVKIFNFGIHFTL
jgi:TonB-linked SusC/RagA family outer membrane protein